MEKLGQEVLNQALIKHDPYLYGVCNKCHSSTEEQSRTLYSLSCKKLWMNEGNKSLHL